MAVISAAIDVTKLDKERFITGKPQTRPDGNGGERQVTPLYCDLTLIETPDSMYGDSHMVVQSVSREERESGVRGQILGNAKTFDLKQREHAIGEPTTEPAPGVADDVPF